MFLRFLGRLFLYFYVIPAFSRAVRKIVIPTISDELRKKMKEDMKSKKMEAQFDRNNTPDWARDRHRQRS